MLLDALAATNLSTAHDFQPTGIQDAGLLTAQVFLVGVQWIHLYCNCESISRI